MQLTPAPEFPDDLQWLNTDRPLYLRELRGKLVLLDFWTYGCINCLHILPDLKRLEAKYARELAVIGVHTAKYGNEAVLANLHQAIRRYDIQHPVINDHESRVWSAYRVSGWPTQILIDPNGHVLQGFIGEYHDQRLDRLIADTIALHRQRGTLRDAAPLSTMTSPSEPDTPLRYPGKVLADAVSSHLWIADTQHHRVILSDLDGNLLAVVGRGAAGSADGDFASATFRQPQGLALQGGQLYVADTGNHLVRRVDLATQRVDTVAGTGVRAREFNVPGYGRAAQLNSPWDLHSQGNSLYIAMAGMHQIWRLDLETTYVEPFAGTGREALIDDVHSDAAFGQPSGLSGDGRHLYVADTEVNAVRAVSLAPNGMTATLAGGGLFTFGDRDGVGREAQLQHPLGIAAAAGGVYVADTYNHKIKRLETSTGHLTTVAGTGTAGWRDGAAAQAQFGEPGGISAVAGQLYVADTNNHRVRVVNLNTYVVTTLPLHGLTLPEDIPSAPSGEEELTEVLRLSEQSLPASVRTAMHIALHAPAGWQVNARAPGLLAVTVKGRGVGVPDAYTKKILRPMPPELEVPVETAPAGVAALLRVDLKYVLCRKGDQAVCVPRQIAWEVPVRSRSQAVQTELMLHDRMTSIAQEFAD
jgi:DNA-binding beta-propeller fold protein YncE/thiol-disulfide isomerase/thioredoxin